jgi:hypothetical protein
MYAKIPTVIYTCNINGKRGLSTNQSLDLDGTAREDGNRPSLILNDG